MLDAGLGIFIPEVVVLGLNQDHVVQAFARLVARTGVEPVIFTLRG